MENYVIVLGILENVNITKITIQAKSERSAKMKASKMLNKKNYEIVSLYDSVGFIAYKEKYKKTGWKRR
ncbi:MAG: hypothetical protein PHS04_00505 [Tissierellia bacterium]|nr:hypothetical protein [Tissierellia bacterium]